VSTPALDAAEALGLPHCVIRHGPVRSLAEAAQARGVAPADVVKTLVVRRGEDDFLFVLVPGDRAISWPKLRRLLGVSRLSMPDARWPGGQPDTSVARSRHSDRPGLGR
jgi:Cys-tRNA(Pro)/Cys-tRNA(Cys) deacylase